MADPTRDRLTRLEERATPDSDARGRLADLWRLAVRTVVDTFEDRVPGMAAEMAFYVVLSLPPLLLAILGSVGFVVGTLAESEIASLEQQILTLARTFLTEETVSDVLAEPVQALLREGRSDILSLGVVLTLWSASRATNVILRILTLAYDLEDPRPGWKRRLLALVITLAGILMAVVVLPILVLGPRVATLVIEAAGLDPGLTRFWSVAYWVGVTMVVLVALTWLYHVAPGWGTAWRRDFPGAVLALLVWLAAGFGLRLYVTRFFGIAGDAAFQGLATLLVLLLWIYLTAIALLLGAELNAEIERMWPSRPQETEKG
jgi:membrane protein